MLSPFLPLENKAVLIWRVVPAMKINFVCTSLQPIVKTRSNKSLLLDRKSFESFLCVNLSILWANQECERAILPTLEVRNDFNLECPEWWHEETPIGPQFSSS